MNTELLHKGIYTIPEAARILGVPYQRIRGWVIGYPNTAGDPIIRNEFERLGERDAISFTNLMEARFIDFFNSHGVHLNSLRVMADEARRVFQHPHPFALATIFKTDGRKVFAEAQEKTGDKKLYDLRAKNWAIYDVLSEAFLTGVEFNPRAEAKLFRPRVAIAPQVGLRPTVAFGQPILIDANIPTSALYDAFNAEGETYESVAAWFEVTPEQVREAVRFELELKRAA